MREIGSILAQTHHFPIDQMVSHTKSQQIVRALLDTKLRHCNSCVPSKCVPLFLNVQWNWKGGITCLPFVVPEQSQRLSRIYT